VNVPVELVVVELVVVLVSACHNKTIASIASRNCFRDYFLLAKTSEAAVHGEQRASDILPDHRPPLPALIMRACSKSSPSLTFSQF